MDIFNKTLYVFSTSRAIRQYISNKKSSNNFLPSTISIGDFFSKIIVNENRVLISSDLRILYLKQAITKVNIKKLGFSSDFAKFYTQSDYIFKFFNELNSEFKDISDLNTADTYAFYLEHLDILNKIYKQYCLILQKNNKIDSSTIATDYTINNDYLKQYKSIQINYEGYFSSFEFNVINAISKNTHLIINITTNEFNTKNISMFKSIGIELHINNIYKLDITNKIIISKEKYINDLSNHKIYPIKQRISQVAFVKYALTNMIKSGILAQNIAVILPDENFANYLKLFDDEKYFNFAMGNDIKSSITYINANAINNYFNKNEPKYEKSIDFFEINKEFLIQNIKPYWNKKVNKDNLFKIIDFIYSDEKDEDIVEHILQIKLSLEILLFSNQFEFNNNDEIKLKDAYKIFLNKIKEISLDDTRAGKITVIGILETRDVSYDGVIVVDFNDNKIPKRSIKDKFISTKVKEYASLPTLKDREDLQKYYYKRLFDKSQQIYISYVNDDSNTISRFATQLFKKQNLINADFSKVMDIKNNIELFKQNIYMDINLSLQEWSATSLKTYLQCKRMYYLNYILGIKEHNISLKPASYELGQILHIILEKIYKQSNITNDNLNKEISKYQNKNPYLTLELEIWKKKLKKFVQNEQMRFKNENINIYALEVPFKVQYKNITIKGVIDRIDKLEDNTYAILDYKTSGTLKIDTLKTIENSNDFQLEFYALARRDLNISKVAYYDLNDASIKEEILLDEKIKILDDIFKGFDTKEVNFKKCEDKKACTFCIYKTICGED